MSELKALAESVEKVNRNLTEMRTAADENSKSMVQFGQEVSAAKEKLQQMETDMADALQTILEVKRQATLAASSSHPEALMTPEEVAGKKAVLAMLRHAVLTEANCGDAKSRDMAQKALSSLTAPDGGFWVPKDMTGRIVSQLKDMSPLRRYADVQTISTASLTGPIDNQEAEAGWTSEGVARVNTNTPKTGQWEIPAHEMYAQPKSTQTLLDDAAYDVEGWLIRKLTDRFGRLEADAFINGNGTGKPKGLLAQSFVATGDSSRAWGKVEYMKTGVNGGFAAAPNSGDILISLMTALRTAYWNGAIWAMNRYTLAKVMQLKDSQGEYIWLPDFSMGAQGKLLGMPVDAGFDHMPSVANGSLSIAFGNFREAYQIVDRQGMRVTRDALTAKPYVQFYTTKRTGGDVVNYEAYKVLKFEA